MGELFLRFGSGLTDKLQVPTVMLAEGTVNFFPSDDNEYLENYPGKTDWFWRDLKVDSRGTAPGLQTTQRICTFRDYRMKEHIVFVQGMKLRETDGNSFRELYTFLGRAYNGLSFPHLFIHEGKLIIVNFGDPVLMWDGVENVHPLGVQEAPMAPEVRNSTLPLSDLPGVSVGYHGPWPWVTWWWPGIEPNNGPGSNIGIDASTKVTGIYKCVSQFADKYGNKGKVSPPSKVTTVPPDFQEDGATQLLKYFLYMDYTTPRVEDHITGVILGRTLNLNPDGGLGSEGIYYREATRDNVTESRLTMMMSDASLTAGGLIDTLVGGPPQATGGCSWGKRTWLWGLEDANVLAFSDVDFFGQYRLTNRFRAADHVVCAVPMGDRLAVITRSSVEVLYDNNGSIGILQQDFGNGSAYGRSFVDAGEGIIFGLWNVGFGFFDGKEHKYIEAPYWIKQLYVDEHFFIHSSVKIGNTYFLTIRKDMVTSNTNYLLMYELTTQRWFILGESIYDLCVWHDTLLGVDNSVYELFKGNYPATSTLNVKGLIPQQASPLSQRTMTDLRILLEPSSSSSFDVEIGSEFNIDPATETEASSLQSQQDADRFTHTVPYWDQVNLLYSAQPPWGSPRDIWARPILNGVVSGYYHSVKLTFPIHHRIRVKALGVEFGEESRSR